MMDSVELSFIVSYPVEIQVVISEDSDVINSYLRKYGSSDAGKIKPFHECYTHISDDLGVLVIFKPTSLTYAAIGHEVFHIVKAVMDSIGIRLSDKSDEAYAYYFEDVYSNIESGLKSRDVKILDSIPLSVRPT